MKNVFLKFAGLFVERVPVDERGNPTPGQGAAKPGGAGAGGQGQPAQPNQPGGAGQHGQVAYPGQAPQAPPMQAGPAGAPQQGQPMHGMPMQAGQASSAPRTAGPNGQPAVSVALRAWVPQEYASHLAPFGVHVIAAGGNVTSEQARGWGADVLVVSAECLGADAHLLQQPQIATVFITPQPVMIPDVPGVVQAQEPLRASDVAQAVRDAAASFAAARR